MRKVTDIFQFNPSTDQDERVRLYLTPVAIKLVRGQVENPDLLLQDRLAEGERWPAMAMAGGVSANRELRRQITALCEKRGVPLYMPRLDLCTDNGAMIGSAAYYRLRRGETADLALNAVPALRLVR